MFQLWSLGVVINLFLFYSIFDIHFKSPIVPVDRRHKLNEINGVEAPFKRAVFFGADGLRAETFFHFSEYRPYLSKVMSRDSSVWGISDTRLPTESRPGHVALFAGFYEDPSAVFTGWKENTVEFDTIFNQTKKSIGLGSPDIVSIFSKGAAQQMYSATYPREWQDFMGENLTMLDTWVFDQFQELVRKKELPGEKDEAVIFLHLLAIDTIGHSAKPQSEDYKRAMEYVDDLIRQVEQIVNQYYGDDETLYVFTSDHGMTDWGSHGDGSEHETETPFVVWGKGISSSEPLRLQQADFAALLAGSLGIGFPSNSVGRFPSSFWTDRRFAYNALKTNLFQIMDLMKTKKGIIKDSRNLPIIEFPLESSIIERVKKGDEFASTGGFTNSIRILNEAIGIALEGILYYERYDVQLLVAFTVTTTVFWIFIVALTILQISSIGTSSQIRRLKIFSLRYILISVTGSFIITKVIIGWSLWRTPYGFFPLYLIILLLKLLNLFVVGRGGGEYPGKNVDLNWLNSLFLLLVFCGLGVEILVNSFESRGVLSVGLLLNGFWCIRAKKVSSWQKTLFFLAVLGLALFPMMPVIGKKRDPVFVTLGPIFSAGLVSTLLYIRIRGGGTRDWTKIPFRDRVILGSQLILLVSVSVLCHFPSFPLTRALSWLSVIQSYFFPIFVSADTVTFRLISVFVAIASPFSFISFSYEALFFPQLFLVLMILLKIEMSGENLEDSWGDFLELSTESRDRRKMWEKKAVDLHQAVRRAWLHLFFVTLSFFGTGNIASINSFDPSSTRCFVSVFSPWLMMLVLIEKILGPMLLVSCFFRRLLWSPSQVERSFLIVLLLCQGMALHTFFNVRNQGSWLEIGMSISHHVIVSATTLFLFALHFIADFLMGFEPSNWCAKAGLEQSRLRFSIPSTSSEGYSTTMRTRNSSVKKAF